MGHLLTALRNVGLEADGEVSAAQLTDIDPPVLPAKSTTPNDLQRKPSGCQVQQGVHE
jgi:hypothetical protein